MSTLTIKGMHCDACRKLISMELEDAQLSKHIESLTVSDKQMGVLILKQGTSEDTKNLIKNTVNGMGEYTVE